jgi:hypothetical protein
MLLHARSGSGERRKVALNELVVEALSLAYHGVRAQDPNLNLTPRAADDRKMRRPEPQPRRQTTAGRIWVCEVRASSLRCGSSGGDSAAPAEAYFALLGAPEIATIAPQSSGI